MKAISKARTSTPKTPRRASKVSTKRNANKSLVTAEKQETNVTIDFEVPILNESVFNSTNNSLDLNKRDGQSANMLITRSNDENLHGTTNSLMRSTVAFETNDKDEILCSICQQRLDDIIFYDKRPLDGKSEAMSIVDNRLVLFDGEENNEYSQEDTRAYNKITCFSVYCKNGHLCSFDSGLIDKDKEIYFSGYVKPIYSEDPVITDGVAIPGKNFGPIVEWWTTGFDVGEKPTVGFCTELGDYLLMEPSPEYASFMETATLKIFVSKTVIEFVLHEPDASYEDLLRKLQVSPLFTEDDLMRLAPFICMQLMSFDELSNPAEQLLVVSPCIRRMMDLAGIDFRYNYLEKSQSTRIGRETRVNKRKKRLYNSDEINSNLSLVLDHRNLIEVIFHCNQTKIPQVASKNTLKCECCVNCRRPGCGECLGCTLKKNCWRKRCAWSEIQDANIEDEWLSKFIPTKDIPFSTIAYNNKITGIKEYKKDVALLGPPIAFDNGDSYYESAKVSGFHIKSGDFVCLRSSLTSVPPQIMKVHYIYENNSGEAMCHANFYWWGKDTVLGEFSNPKEVFNIALCSNIPLASISKKVKVVERKKPVFWDQSITAREFNEDIYFCEKSFEPLTGKFYDLPVEDETLREKSQTPYKFCKIQVDVDHADAQKKPRVLTKLDEKDNKIMYEKVYYKNEEYFVGSTVYIKPRKLYFKFPMSNNNAYVGSVKNETIDDKKYTESYRIKKIPVKELQHEILPILDIGFITELFSMDDKIFMRVKKFYRPENTHDGKNLIKKSNLNQLFWSEEETEMEFTHVIGKCYVVHKNSIKTSVDQWTAGGPDRFYFSKEYQDETFVDVNKERYKGSIVIRDIPKEHPVTRKLKTLNIFAGCGGLAMGFQRSGLASIKWAIEPDKAALSVFQLNMTKTEVFNTNVKSFLEAVKNVEEELDKPKIPTEEVEFLCATIPGKNYKSLENFKNSDVATFIEYCEYYRPVLFAMDADENLVKHNDFLKLTLSCFVTIGYQVTFNVMQVGNFGVPQNRKRSVILGAAPGYKLPSYPKNLHVFPKSMCQFHVIVDDKKYCPIDEWNNSAPFRSVNVHDAISDLPLIAYGQYKNDLGYYGKLLTHYQKLMRLGVSENDMFDHECKKFSALVHVRFLLLPLSPGSDWRNLPNSDMKLIDGSHTKKLIYTHDDTDAGKNSAGDMRGVCSCANGSVCDLNYRQEDTIIPWHLVHSAKRHNQWAGLYSRLQWDGYFGNITNPEPLGTEGPVIHPQQPRVVSVRECARSQGFPDDFKLGDAVSTHDKYRLIGQSTSPLLSLCLGSEIKKSLL
ncbi:DNA (cytosine-5)-methyltransferase PliMCI [Copidosoma floridanum]|uniref:DNA (cytosine-5)-methyltransferase PliMCI n=1 Tax=Copidosoma floridanum TaxID=29053 RepID=UPI000C6F9509|nr:DNA (cytosine-5)-methyltransferase PliMCI [Copidosoma floridanum]